MPRRGQIAKRDVLPDPLYNSKVVTRLINNIMLDGKKGVAQKIVYNAFDIIQEKTGNDPIEVFEAAIAVSAVQHTRYPLRYVPREDRLSVSDGLLPLQEQGRKEQ